MDMIADVDEETLRKYDLKLDSTIHSKMSENPVFAALEMECQMTYVPGGCSYNTMRVFNWMVKSKNQSDITGLLGSVGDDFYGKLYEDLLSKETIVPIFEKFDKINTGVCCVFCHDRDRGHITDLGASVNISEDYVQRIWEEIKQVELVYTELFILKHKKNVVYMLAELAQDNSKIFGFNLPSFYFIETFFDDISNLIGYADFFFANAAEAKFFGKLLNIQDSEYDIGELCKVFAKLPKKNQNKKRVVVITSGPETAYCAEYDFGKEQITFYEGSSPDIVDESLIVDTNGAGDAFAGGFLSRYVKQDPLGECMRAGHWAAAIIIQTRGCQIPNDKEYKGI